MKEFAINLEEGEKLILRRKGVRRGALGSYNNELILTNLYLICVTYSVLNQPKDSKIFLLSDVKDVGVGRGRNSELCLEVTIGASKQSFYFEPGTLGYMNPREYENWCEAISAMATMSLEANIEKEKHRWDYVEPISEVEVVEANDPHKQLEDLRNLQEMLNEGLISKEEFNEMKMKILGLM